MTIAGTAQVHNSLPAWRHWARTGAAVSLAAMAVLLTACGGGDQVNEFKPAKMVSFGDEGSALVEQSVGSVGTIKGAKYGVNAMSLYTGYDSSLAILAPTGLPATATLTTTQAAWVDYPSSGENTAALALNTLNDAFLVQRVFNLSTTYTDTSLSGTQTGSFDVTYQYAYSCVDNRLWVQILANSYGFGFKSQCPMETRSGAVTYAENGATVTSTATQVANHRAELGSDTLVTMMAGQNDILDAYAQVKAGTLTLDAAKANMTTKGGELATIVNDIIKTGARVLLVKLPDLGVSPLALNDGGVGPNRLEELSKAFNNGILNKITNDGTKIGLVNFYDYSRYIKESPSSYGFNNVTTPLCDATVYQPDGTPVTGGRTAPFYGGAGLLNCNSLTTSGQSVTTYFWADEVHLSPGAHSYLGSLAYNRAKDNPF